DVCSSDLSTMTISARPLSPQRRPDDPADREGDRSGGVPDEQLAQRRKRCVAPGEQRRARPDRGQDNPAERQAGEHRRPGIQEEIRRDGEDRSESEEAKRGGGGGPSGTAKRLRI